MRKNLEYRRSKIKQNIKKRSLKSNLGRYGIRKWKWNRKRNRRRKRRGKRWGKKWAKR